MSPPSRLKGESLSAQRAGSPDNPPSRLKGESLSAQRAGSPVSLRRHRARRVGSRTRRWRTDKARHRADTLGTWQALPAAAA
jgi:hypothetical protein